MASRSLFTADDVLQILCCNWLSKADECFTSINLLVDVVATLQRHDRRCRASAHLAWAAGALDASLCRKNRAAGCQLTRKPRPATSTSERTSANCRGSRWKSTGSFSASHTSRPRGKHCNRMAAAGEPCSMMESNACSCIEYRTNQLLNVPTAHVEVVDTARALADVRHTCE